MASRALASDPLAGLPFFGRWQTHVPGSNDLLGNLFQDTSFVTPTTIAGNPIGGFRSILGVSTDLTQGLTDNKTTLDFDSGVPVVDCAPATAQFFNVPDTSGLTEGEFFLLWKNNVTNDGSNMMHLGTGQNSFLPFSVNGLTYDSFGTDTRKDAISITYPGGYNIYNSSSKAGEWRNALNGVEQFTAGTNTVAFPSDGTFGCANMDWAGGGKVIAVFIFSQVLTDPQRALVNSYLNDLKP